MLRRLADHFDDMALALTIWLCTLPLVGLFVVPFFGLQVGLVVAVAFFIVALVLCWGVCSWKVFKS